MRYNSGNRADHKVMRLICLLGMKSLRNFLVRMKQQIHERYASCAHHINEQHISVIFGEFLILYMLLILPVAQLGLFSPP